MPAEEEHPTDVGPSRRRRESRWLLIVLGSAILAVGLGVVLLDDAGQDDGSPADPSASSSATAAEGDEQNAGEDLGAALPPRLRAELSALATRDLEQASPNEHAHHGHHFEGKARLLCVAEPFGVDPPDATRVTDVEKAYIQHMCVSAEPGRPWDFSPKTSGPLVYLPGDPPQTDPEIKGPQPDRHYADQVRELIPRRYHEQAFAPFPPQELFDYLRKRFNAVVY